jgi:hypothetical protein
MDPRRAEEALRKGTVLGAGTIRLADTAALPGEVERAQAYYEVRTP